MAKIAIITDTHFQIRHGKQSFENHIINYLCRVIDYCAKNNIKKILHLGDFFDVRSNVSMKTLQAVKRKFLDILKMHDIEIHMIPGNHDTHFKNTLEVNSVSLLFTEYDNVFVYEKPTVVYFDDSSSVLMVPWITPGEREEFERMIDLGSLESSICCGHFEFSGFLYQKGIYSVDGEDVSTYTPKFELILSGHYHSKSSQGIVHYLGTGCDLTWADYEEKKYFHVLDTVTQKLEAIENPDRMFHQIFYDEKLIDQDALKELKEIDFRDKIIKVIVQKRRNMILFDEFIEILYSNNPDEVSIVDETVVKTIQNASIDTEILVKGTLEIINEMLDEIDIPEDLSSEHLKKIVYDLYQESQV